MERKLQIKMIAALIILSLIILTGCSSTNSKDTVTLKLGTINTSNSVDGLAAEKFKETVEKLSDGKLIIELYHNSQLGPTMTQIEGTMLGTQDMILAGMELYEKWAPDLKILTAFYVFDDDKHFDAFIKSPIFEDIKEQVEAQNVTWINESFNWITGPYRVLVTTEPVESLEDLKGMKLRMPEVETLQKSWKQLGAVPITISWGETYLSLNQNIVSGLEAPVSIIKPNKFTEIAKYMTEVRTFPQRMSLAMNSDKLKSLSDDEKQILKDAAEEAGEYYSQIVEEAALADVEAMKAEDGLIYYTPDLKPWKEKMEPLIYELEKDGYLRAGLYDEIKALKN